MSPVALRPSQRPLPPARVMLSCHLSTFSLRGRERPIRENREGSGSASSRPRRRGQPGDARTESAPCPTGNWNLPWGAVTTQVDYLGEPESFGIRPEGLKDERQVGDPHVGAVPWLTGEP